MQADAIADEARERAPSHLVQLADDVVEHNVLLLAAGLAFFGILSIGPAIAVGFGLLRLLASPEAASSVVDLLKGTFSEQLGLAELLEQMEDRGARYAGLGLLVLLWPATTLASGWTRALNDIDECDTDNALRGLKGRLRGLAPGAVLVAGLLLMLGAVTFGTALVGSDGVVLAVALVLCAVVLQVLFNLMVYRWLPSERLPVRVLWPGALWATAGVALATLGLAGALTIGEGLAQRYPTSLVTSVVIGLWLYGANLALLLGAEHNRIRRLRSRP
jgi:membrane protein